MTAPSGAFEDPTTLEVAMALLAEGLAPLPIQPGRKAPIEKDWTKKPIPSVSEVRTWFGNGSKYNIGIRTGRVSGIAVLDVDDAKGGDDGLDALISKYGPLPDTVVGLTPNGRHFYFLLPPNVSVGNSVCKLGTGLDIRGEGGQVLCHPSVVGDKSYEFDGGELPKKADIAPLPPWFLALVTDARRLEKADKGKPEGEKRRVIHAAGGRNDTLFRLASSMRNQGLAEEAIRDALLAENLAHCIPPLDTDEVLQIAKSCQRYEPSPQYLQTWKEGLQMGKKQYKGNMSNLALILSNDTRCAGKIAYNEITGECISTDILPWKKTPGVITEDGDLPALRAWIANKHWCGYEMDEPGREAARDAVRRVADFLVVNPLTDWLRGLQWDGNPRIDWLLADTWAVEHNAYHTAVSRILLIGAVQRAISPGCKMDYMPILQGAQGLLKSTFFARLYSPWFAEKSTSHFDGADAALEVSRSWCVEVAELNAFSRSDVNAIKGFLSRQIDVYRPPYGREFIARPRRCLMVGTTNDDHYLRDTTGNRRFLPVVVTEPCRLDLLSENREQYFAEAMHRISEEIHIQGDALAPAMAAQEAAVASDPWEGLIAEWIDQPRNEGRDITTQILLAEAVEVKLADRTPAHEARIGRILKTLGFTSVQVRVTGSADGSGGRRRVYRRPLKTDVVDF